MYRRLPRLVMELPSSRLPKPEANRLAIVAPKGLLIATILVFTPSPIAIQAGTASEKYFNDYHLYMVSAADSPHDLPLYPRLHPASRHDAVSLVMSTV
jgi:hypothetical protein